MDGIEKLLRSLFDFQRFKGNKRLDRIIQHSTEGGGNGLPLEDSQMEVNAAGEPETWRIPTGREDDKR